MIYIASPYSDPDPVVRERRYQAVCRYAASRLCDGVQVFSPIAHSHSIALYGELPTGIEFWRDFDSTMIHMSTAIEVLMLPGWQESEGVKWEIALAEMSEIPVWYVPRERETPPPMTALDKGIAFATGFHAPQCAHYMQQGCNCAWGELLKFLKGER